MFLRIILEIQPQFIRKSIFGIDIRIQNIPDFQMRIFFYRKGECLFPLIQIIPESDDHNTFPVLRDIIFPIHDLIMDIVSQFLKRIGYHMESPAFIMGLQIFYILEIKCFGTFSADYLRNIKNRVP